MARIVGVDIPNDKRVVVSLLIHLWYWLNTAKNISRC